MKKIALVNDVTGYGRCSTAVALPLVSALKVQGCILPTAILSVHTEFPTYYFDDYTAHMRPYIESWKKNKLAFDGICTGFLGSLPQIDIVAAFLRDFKKKETLVIMDPVMGDHGALYETYTPEMCQCLRTLLSYADVLTPNLTEACALAGVPYRTDFSQQALRDLAASLAAQGPQQIVITGLSSATYIDNFLYDHGEVLTVRAQKQGTGRPGTGDVLTAIVAASLVRGETLPKAVEKAAVFISKTLAYTEKIGLPHNEGLAIEEYLTELR